MLVLSRKAGETVYVGDEISVTVVRINSRQVRLKIDAPKHVSILREELVIPATVEQADEMWADLTGE